MKIESNVIISRGVRRTTTSIKIDKNILLEAKHHALDERKTFSKFFEEALKEKISKSNIET